MDAAVAAVVLTLYMPPTLALWWARRCARVLQPRMRLVFPALCAWLCSLVGPATAWTPEVPCSISLLWFGLGIAGSTAYVTAAIVLVLRYRVTEMLFNAMSLQSAVLDSLRWLRFGLHPPVHISACLLTTLVSLGCVIGLLDAPSSAVLEATTCLSPSTQLYMGVALALLGAVGAYVSVMLYAVDDVYGLQWAYQRTLQVSVVVLLGVGGGRYVESHFQGSMLNDYGVGTLLCVLLPHTLFLINVVPPLYQLGMRHRIVEPNAVAPDDIALFQRFLRRPDTYLVFLQYCRLALRLEELLSWKAIERGTNKPWTLRSGWKLYTRCMDPSAPLLTHAGRRWRPYYMAKLKTSRLRIQPDDAPLPRGFFEPLMTDLVLDLYLDVLPWFERHSLGLAWHEFRFYNVHTTQRTQSGARVSGSRRSSFVISSPLEPIPVSRNEDDVAT
ncbi:hypothetical protein SDRG_07137 [Saprolegnia diclina VS20]|uniref:RGS domain-containing protein n=1 Tax=Saprolegnia diclina (strain VS20) TaxID=1156394 RepID=T0RYG5_SAPDV|nr:hypothetical protein SDRG_07137 [Saprolegnia diclina VS20]EQC35427.1 hypothetical protein SDRG_07137 [Saprolegnia diclina VS20]|eukprot:XP_008611177.1 hypothetical protein SDRG_07137 [Saprolegnia diclina VS20]